jgi:hypothetical protein
VKFKAWYAGGDTFQGCCDAWEQDLPGDGVLCVKVWFENGASRVCAGDDWYGLLRTPDGHWTIIHNRDTAQENARRYPTVAWKRGTWTSEVEMAAVIDLMARE